jgi:ABC-type uncharacterized transport system involved in gliding motility auxiliary subunit
MQRKYIGRILGAVGLVLLVSSPFTWVISTPTIAAAKVVLALVFFGVYFATNFGDLGQFASSKGTFFFGVSAVSAVVLLCILGAANYIAAKNPKTWDLTKNQIHTLAPDTLKTLEALKEDVSAVAVYRTGEAGYDVLNDLFTRYQGKSAHFKYEFVDYAKDPVRVSQLGVKENGPRVVVKMGATESRFQELNEEQLTNATGWIAVDPEQLTNAIVKVTHAKEKKLYFSTGHGEADPDDTAANGYSEVKKRMEGEGLKAEKLNLAGATEIPTDAQALIIAGPAKPFQPGEVEIVKKYLDAGGKAFVMVEPQMTSGLEDLLKEYNVEAEDSVVVDPISRLFGAAVTIPVVQNYNAESEIVRDFKLNTVYPTARPLAVLHTEKPAKANPLALSMPSAWGETTPQGEVKRDDNEKGGPFPLVVTATLDTKANAQKRGDEARLVVAGDRDFASNKFRNAYGNEDFFLNCVNWLSEQSDRITIRPRMRDASRLYLTDTQKASIFFVAIDILPVTLLAIGLSVWLVRRSK